MRSAVWWFQARVRACAEGEKPRRAASAAREDPRQKEALPVTIVWILIVIILVLLVIALARRVL
jgi:flagellar basal body-associated protein FliL